ncbi:MAG: DNA gyrase inhibitor YacG [Methyloversatilis sp.]|uniref:DNA gyrase inhibitor YacG n=1 Tax=Methyloversatilis sp. TaxID=2569862 RepID=UPI0027361CC2|nr:DNA gyrase inhibitor YacG [Methyloversatilis sp.]MDP3872741.1 DNA gyrase inhibitor YacG [Methyloversatilis sp.]
MVTCPRCGQPAVYAPSNPARPFCSPRCKNSDFVAWANEEYRVPDASPEVPPDEDIS